jgi:hypothetical protein
MLGYHDACLAALVHVMCLRKREGGREGVGEREGGGEGEPRGGERESLCTCVSARAH